MRICEVHFHVMPCLIIEFAWRAMFRKQANFRIPKHQPRNSKVQDRAIAGVVVVVFVDGDGCLLLGAGTVAQAVEERAIEHPVPGNPSDPATWRRQRWGCAGRRSLLTRTSGNDARCHTGRKSWSENKHP